MAKLTRKTTGKVESQVVITSEEIRVLILEKYPGIRPDAVMEIDTDFANQQTFELVCFRWSEDADKPDEVIELRPAGCNRKCPRSVSRIALAAEQETNE